MIAACALASCKKKNNNDSGTTANSGIPFVNDFTCDYYDEYDNIISDKSTTFAPDDEIRVKISFTLSNEAYAAGKRNFTVKFKPTVGFDGRIMYANSSSTSDKDFTATYSVDDRNAKICEVEARITVRFSRGSLTVAYSYDGEEFSSVLKTPLNNDKTLSFKYDEDTDGYEVSKDPQNYKWLEKAVQLNFPESFDGQPVTAIDDYLFEDCDNLTSVSVPSSVKYISGGSLFSNCPIEEASLPTSVINSYNVPKSTLKSVKIVGGGIIGYYEDNGNAFCGLHNCGNLTSVELSDDIEGAVRNAFYGCDKLEYNDYYGTLYLGNTKNPYLALVTTNDGLRYNSGIGIHSSTKVIFDSAFAKCTSLENIKLPDGLRIIGREAFYSCNKLKSVTIPDSVTKIGNYAFNFYYTSSDNYTNRADNINTTEYGGAYYLGNDNNPYAALVTGKKGATSVEIHPSTKVISDQFGFWDSITSVKINGVTSIRDGAFKNCENLQSVTISDSVTSIGDNAFSGCSNLKNITIPDSVTSIGSNAFDGCDNLKCSEYGNAYYLGNEKNPYVALVKVKDGATSVEVNSSARFICTSFANLESLKSVTINGVASIGESAFYNCTNLQSITISDGVTGIGKFAFSGCVNLSNLTLPSYATFIGRESFSGCKSLTSITIPKGVVSIGYSAFNGCSSLTSVSMPDSVIYLGDYAFKGCENLKSVTLSKGLMRIGANAFYECGNLTSIAVPDGVTSIGANAFYECGNLTSATMDGVTSIGESAFMYCGGLIDVTVSDEIMEIGDSAFYGCNNLQYNEYGGGLYLGNEENPYAVLISVSYHTENLEINSSTRIIYGKFTTCRGLTSVTIPSSVSSIGNEMFKDCDDLTSVVISDGVTSIGDSAFKYCSDLKTVIIPNSVTKIGADAFSGCSNLQYYEYGGALYLGNAKNHYVALVGIKEDATSVQMSPSTKVIGDGVFAYNQNLTSVTIDGVTTIGDSAFLGCSGLTSVIIPNGVTTIGNSAFLGCSGLTSVTIPNGVTAIGSQAFYRCAGLTSVNIPSSVKRVGSKAFAYCTFLTDINIPDGVTTIGDSTFLGCISLTSMTIPDSVTSIENYAFKNCNSLKSVTLTNNVVNIGYLAFNGCAYLTSINFNGTKDEWLKISSAAGSASDDGSVTVKCSDGDIKFKLR